MADHRFICQVRDHMPDDIFLRKEDHKIGIVEDAEGRRQYLGPLAATARPLHDAVISNLESKPNTYGNLKPTAPHYTGRKKLGIVFLSFLSFHYSKIYRMPPKPYSKLYIQSIPILPIVSIVVLFLAYLKGSHLWCNQIKGTTTETV